MRTRRLIAALLLCALATPLAAAEPRQQAILFERDSRYHHIVVAGDTEGYVWLMFDRKRGYQSRVKLGNPGWLELSYSRMAFVGLAFLDEPPKDVLFAGLGGAAMPMFMRHHYPDANIDIAEIDPMVEEVARKYFGFKPDERMKVRVKDARTYIRTADAKKKYDLIFLDAYNNNSIPFHLTTEEFLQLVAKRLKPGGYVVGNIWSPTANKYYSAMVKTYQKVFPSLYIFQAPKSGNQIFVATTKKGRVPADKVAERARAIEDERRFSYKLSPLALKQYEYATPRRVRAEVLTDDHAPVNILRAD